MKQRTACTTNDITECRYTVKRLALLQASDERLCECQSHRHPLLSSHPSMLNFPLVPCGFWASHTHTPFNVHRRKLWVYKAAVG